MGNFRQNVQDQLPKSRHFYFAYNAFQDVMAKEPPEQSSLSELFQVKVQPAKKEKKANLAHVYEWPAPI